MHKGLILTSGDAPARDENLAQVLRFFGIPHEISAIDEDEVATKTLEEGSDRRVFCSARAFLRFLQRTEQRWPSDETWRDQVHSVFVFAGDDLVAARELSTRLTGDERAMREVDLSAGTVSVSDEQKEFCSVMSGLKGIHLTPIGEPSLLFDHARMKGISLIKVGDDSPFARFEYRGVPVFFSTSNEVIDLAAPVAGSHFDVRDHFLSAVSIVLYLRWAFAPGGRQVPETNACVIIDDPLLKAKYGFINFHKLLDLMLRHKFSASIAFIPWNWNRSSRPVVSLFKAHPEQLSLSVHGCDHTASEFGSSDRRTLVRKVKQPTSRMEMHEKRTGLPYDRVMVFPQGVFSEEALQVLKEQNFLAAVNTAVNSTDDPPRKITVASCWDVAVVDYNNFPIFTRRYPSERIENFAFDILLGKPCLVVIHHDFCRDNYASLARFIDQLNGLNCSLAWRNLGEVVRRSFRQRLEASGKVEVEMYGSELRLSNTSSEQQRFTVKRREEKPDAIEKVVAGAAALDWEFKEGRITWTLDLEPKGTALIRVVYREATSNTPEAEPLLYKLKTAARRHLCEARDNYLQPALHAIGALK